MRRSLTGIPEKLLERDNFLTAEAALEMGLVDEIVTARKSAEKEKSE